MEVKTASFTILSLLLVLQLVDSYRTFSQILRKNNYVRERHPLFSTSGAAMDIENVFISIGNNDILSNINWSIMPKERWGLVGPNGAGKSTLLKALTQTGGETLSVREGDISLAKKARLGYLEQKGVSGSTRTVREEVSSRMDRVTNAKIALEKAEKAVMDGDCSDEALLALEEANVEFEAAGGYTIEQKISNVLKGLGFLPEDWDKRCNEFSGGWQMRIALARLLLSEPDVLILDEPTNHLDKGARNWLASYLASYDNTLLLVSHDIDLLKTAINSIAEVKNGKVDLYKSRSYDQWLIEREERVKIAQSEYEEKIREIQRLQTFVDRFGAKTMGASLAQSKLKTIEKIEATMDSPDAPATLENDRPAPKLILPRPPRGSELLLEIKNGLICWPGPNAPPGSSPSIPIINNVDITIQRGMRIVVRGPNGAGKSTLLSALSGRLPLTDGTRLLGDGLELGTFTQDLAQDLDQTSTAMDVVLSYVRQKDPTITNERVRSVLGSLGLSQDKSVRLVGMLSGGEKARVALATFVLIPHNLLLLDEPSNHLDIPTLKVLTTALREFEGTTLVISHDKLFLEELEPTHVITVRDGKAVIEERGLKESDWEDDLYARVEAKFATTTTIASEVETSVTSVKDNNKNDNKVKKGKDSQNSEIKIKGSSTPTATATATATATTAANTSKKTTKNNDSNDFRQVSKIESSIAKYEKEIAVLEKEMENNASNVPKLVELQAKKDTIQVKIDKLYQDYEALVA